MQDSSRHQIDGFGSTNLQGFVGEDLFIMLDDDARDRIRDFAIGTDLIDVASFTDSFDDLVIRERAYDDGTLKWISVSFRIGPAEFLIRPSDEAAPQAPSPTVSDVIFSNRPLPAKEPVVITASTGVDKLRGTYAVEVFVMGADGSNDRIRKFDLRNDRIDVLNRPCFTGDC